MEIRQATMADLPAIMSIYESARVFMKKHGNSTQWKEGYPGREVIEADIMAGNCYVCEQKERIAGVFSLIIGEDPTYRNIEHGTWHSTQIYGTIHRLASDGKTGGIAKACFAFCAEKCSYLRIDTHADNLPMQGAILKFGFQKCGIIRVADGSERIAFDIQLR